MAVKTGTRGLSSEPRAPCRGTGTAIAGRPCAVEDGVRGPKPRARDKAPDGRARRTPARAEGTRAGGGGRRPAPPRSQR